MAPRGPRPSLAVSPPARYSGLMSDGGSLASDVLVGGSGVAGSLTDTWTWTGAIWHQLTTANAPLNGDGLAYDGSNDQILMIDKSADTFALGNGPSAPPGGCSQALAMPTVGIASSAGGTGYWIADQSGQVAACGTAPQLATSFTSNDPIVGIAASPTGEGYWWSPPDLGGSSRSATPCSGGSMGGQALNRSSASPWTRRRAATGRLPPMGESSRSMRRSRDRWVGKR